MGVSKKGWFVMEHPIKLIWGSIIEGSIKVKLPTIWTVGKAEVGKVRVEKRKGENIRGQKE